MMLRNIAGVLLEYDPQTLCKRKAPEKQLCCAYCQRLRIVHTFRHTIITDVYEETHDANIAAAVAGHSKTTITMNRYAHARRDSAVRGIKALDEAYIL